MGYEYHINIGCPIQSERSDDEFRCLAKIRVFASHVLEQREAIENANPGRPFEDVPLDIPFSINPLEAGTPSTITMGELIEAHDAVRERATPICADCPVNRRRLPLGCYASITYPITAEAERWLLEQWNPQPLIADYVLFHIRQSGIDGNSLDRGRPPVPGVKRGILEAVEPVVRDAPEFGGKVSSSQLIEYLLSCAPQLIPQTLFGLCTELGVVKMAPADIQMVSLMLGLDAMRPGGDKGKLKSPEALQELHGSVPIVMNPAASDDRSVYKLKEFLVNCWWALTHNGTMAVDG